MSSNEGLANCMAVMMEVRMEVRERQTEELVECREMAAKVGPPLEYILEVRVAPSLDDWIGMTPSRCCLDDCIPNITVTRTCQIWESTRLRLERFERNKKAELHRAFEEMRSRGPQAVTEESIKRLAINYDLTSGKWVMFVDWSQVDEVWGKLVKGLQEGAFWSHLGVSCVQTKGRDKPEKKPYSDREGKRTPISIRTLDWTHRESTMRVAEIARGLGLTNELKYKPDIYTELEVHRHGFRDVSPTIYRLP